MKISKYSYIGVDIGRSAVKLAQFSGKKLSGLAAREIPVSVRKGTREAFVAFAGKAVSELKREKGFHGNLAVTNLSAPTEVQLLNFTLPQMSKSDMQGAVGMEIKKSAGSEIAKSIYDFYVSETLENGSQEIVAAVAGENAVREKIWLLENAGLNIKSFLTTGLALECLLNHIDFLHDEKNTLFIDIGAAVTSFNIFKGKKLKLSREIFLGSDDVTSAMCRTVSTQKGGIEISWSRAEEIKRKYGIMQDAPAMIEGEIPSATLSSLIRPGVERLSKEITRLTLQVSREKETGIEKIYLCGGGGRLKGLDRVIHKNTGIETLTFDPEESVPLEDSPSEEDMNLAKTFDFTAARGLALFKKQKVFLVPDSIKLLQKASLLKKGAVVSCVLVAATAALFYISVLNRTEEYAGFVRDGRAQLEPLLDKIEVRDELKAWRERVASRERIYLGLKQPLSFYGISKELSNLTPEGIKLDSMTLCENGESLTIKGHLFASDMQLSLLLTDLFSSPFFTDLSLVSRTTGSDGGVQFEIKCKLLY